MSRLIGVSLVLAACSSEAEPPILTNATDAPPGPECQYGGKRVEQGPDRDDSGTLDPDEVEDVSFICHGARIHEGDFVVTDDYQAQQLRDISIITGSLVVDAPTVMAEIKASLLVRVDGDVRHTAGILVAPYLQSVGGAMTVKPAITSNAAFAALQTVGGTFTVCGAYDLAALSAIAGDLVIECPYFDGTIPTLRALTTIDGGITIKRWSRGEFVAPLVTHVDFVSANPGLVIENGIIPMKRFGMAALTAIDGQLDISFTDVTALELPMLQTAGSLKFVGDAMLCNSVPLELATRTGAPSEISQNASCFR